MKKIPDWLVVLLWTVTIFFFAYAGWKVLSAEPPMTDAVAILQRFIAPTVILFLAVVASALDMALGVLNDATIETWTFMGSALVSGSLFIVAMCVKDAATKDNILKAATGVGGFALGLKVGSKFDGKSESPSTSHSDSNPAPKNQPSKGKRT
jgi:uncharacterized membrane protein YgdD (TMEM256/DUF423 family)